MKKCVIITTINRPTRVVEKHIENSDYDVIIVGDRKTPNLYKDIDCIYLDLEKQKNLYPSLYSLIPLDHYCRKNFGYLYAIQNGYDVIYETDDDNLPHGNFDSCLNKDYNSLLVENQDSDWINVFKFFTDSENVWPRGYPLSLVNSHHRYLTRDSKVNPSIICGLVDGDPDVDAIFRLTRNYRDISWHQNKSIIASNRNMGVFNTQNTFWVNSDIFISMLIPCSVSFRYCDILRGIIANVILRKNNFHLSFISPNVTQIRNQHDLIEDLKSEYPMYIHNENILNFIDKDTDGCSSNIDLMEQIYNNLLDHEVISKLDVAICSEWIKYFDI